MAAILDHSNPASPLAHPASQTALLLLDFQGFTITLCGAKGPEVFANAVKVRNWALKEGIPVLHSIVDVGAKPPSNLKGRERIEKMLAGIKNDKVASEEPTEIAFSQQGKEYIVLKQPGVISGLKSNGAMELLVERGIRSLIICGLSTSGAVLRTAIPGTDDGFVVTVIRDACADPKEAVHQMCMDTLLPSRAHVVVLEEFLNAWENVKSV